MRSVPVTMSYRQGFLSKFAEYGLDGRPYLSFMMKIAQAAPPQTQQPPKSPRSPQDDPWAPATATQLPPQPQPKPVQAKPTTNSYTPQQYNTLSMFKGMNNNQRMQWLYDHGIDPTRFSSMNNQGRIDAVLSASNSRRSAGSLPWTPSQGNMRRTGIFQGGKEVLVDSRGNFHVSGNDSRQTLINGAQDDENIVKGYRASRAASRQQLAQRQRPKMMTTEQIRQQRIAQQQRQAREAVWTNNPDAWIEHMGGKDPAQQDFYRKIVDERTKRGLTPVPGLGGVQDPPDRYEHDEALSTRYAPVYGARSLEQRQTSRDSWRNAPGYRRVPGY